MTTATNWVCLAVLVTGCGSASMEVPTLVADDSWSVAGPHWSIIGTAITEDTGLVEVVLTPSTEVTEVLVWLDGEQQPTASASGADWSATVDVSALEPGEHTIALSADGGKTAFAEHRFVRSHPLYVVVSIDWDRPDPEDNELAFHQKLHDKYPHVLLTQLVGPYTFTEELPEGRTAELVTWLRDMESTHGDEIGLHIHTYCSFVTSAGVPCRTKPGYVYEDDPSGYTVLSSAYTEQEFGTLLSHAAQLFTDNGLPKPTSYRAGGWIADAKIMRALDAAGIVADSSALNARLIEEWDGQANGVLWDWTNDNWSTIHDTSQPYHPSKDDPLKPGDLTILELPDNAGLADYLSAEEHVQIFQANWPGGALMQPTAYSMGFHNSTGRGIQISVEGALTHIDTALAVNDQGPVVYARMSDLAKVW